MSRRWKIAVAAAVVLGLSALAVQRHMAAAACADRCFDMKWLEAASTEELYHHVSWFKGLSPSKKRELAHRALARPEAMHHDAFIVLAEHGTEESVPYLLDWLRTQDDVKDSIIVCTRGHCIEALEKITGMKLGYNYSDWQDWEKKR